MLSDRTRQLLACPRDQRPLIAGGATLTCSEGHSYPIIDGIPILLRDDVARRDWDADIATEADRKRKARDSWSDPSTTAGVHPYVQDAIGATGGNLYRSLIGRLPRYPLPDIPLEAGGGRTLVDIGCNWGRWTIAASKRGYHAIGVDPSLQALLAAREVCTQLGVEADFVIGDARYLPFRGGSVEAAFSYSVIQHLSPRDARRAVAEIGRVLTPGGRAAVQMPNRFGARCLFHQAMRGFREARDFEVRYWSPGDLLRMFEEFVGPARLFADGFFSLNAQPADADMLPLPYRALVHLSAALARLANAAPPLIGIADSVYVTAERRLRS